MSTTHAKATAPTLADHILPVTRIVMGLLFAWAFADKAFGLGYATPSGRGWFDGGSPTKGFLSGIDHGPFASVLRGWAGAGWADTLFMLGLLGVAVALITGAGLRIAAVSGTVLMALMWVAEWPVDRFTDAGDPTHSTNPLIDYHVVYALILIALAALRAGDTWGLGSRWSALPLVRTRPWLR